jgi:hypothetical protein
LGYLVRPCLKIKQKWLELSGRVFAKHAKKHWVYPQPPSPPAPKKRKEKL